MTHKPLRVLLVQDFPGSPSETRRLILQTDLAQIKLACASTAFAMRAFHRNHFDLCIIDSPSNGIQLLKTSQRVGLATPVILLTTDNAAEVLDAMRIGAADCLIRKALTARTLEESICLTIERARHSEDEAEHARRYLSLVEHADEVIYTHDLLGNSPFINRAGERLIKYKLEEVAKINFRQIISPDCVEAVWLAIERMLANRKQSSCEACLLSRLGQRIPVRVSMHLIYKEGNPVGVQGIARDLRLLSARLPPPEIAQRVSLLL